MIADGMDSAKYRFSYCKKDCQLFTIYLRITCRPVFRGGLRGLKHPPPRNVYTKISGSTFLRKLWTCAAVMNIIMAVIGLVGLKCAPECIKMHHFQEENAPSQTPPPLGRGIPLLFALLCFTCLHCDFRRESITSAVERRPVKSASKQASKWFV